MRKTFLHPIVSLLMIAAMISPAMKSVAQTIKILSPQIASPVVTANEDWQSLPVMELGRGKVDIGFDDLTHTYHRYVYKIEHCNADWTPSEQLFTSDYVQGFADGNTIDDIEESINTNTLYTHYSITLPNDKCRLKMSGNYRLTIQDENEDMKPVLVVCFMVVEQLMNLGLEVTTNTDIDVNKSHQQLNMTLQYGSLRVINPSSEIKTVVLQNRQWHNARINVQHRLTMNDGLRWEHCRDLIFDAGNECHKFEILDPDHASMGVDRIDWDGEGYNAFIFPNRPRENYTYDEDANGSFLIRNSDNIENDYSSEYVNTHFQLFCPTPVNGEVYVNGVWTNNIFDAPYRMEYDYTDKSYKTTIPLKLGYYSYQYLLKTPSGNITLMPTEGNYWQTENEYQVLVYYRKTGDRADRLVAYNKVRINGQR